MVQPPGDVVAGALGAFPDRDGVDVGGAWWWPNNPSGNTEEWEDALPVLYLYRRERQGSGGPGRWRGGNALETAIVLHKTDEMMVQLVSLDNAINCALGLGGGLPAHPGDYRFREAGLPHERLAAGVLPGTPDRARARRRRAHPPVCQGDHDDAPGDVFVAQYCGGGGFGDPLTRGPELVAGDVSSAAITMDDARALYGVVLDGTGSADPQATDELRQRMRADRLAAARPPVAPDDVSLDPEGYTGSAGGAVGFGPASDGEEHWGCLECGHALAPIDQNYKDGAARLERVPQEISPRQYLDPSEFCDDAFVVREFLCPGCGVTLATELCKPDDPPGARREAAARACR